MKLIDAGKLVKLLQNILSNLERYGTQIDDEKYAACLNHVIDIINDQPMVEYQLNRHLTLDELMKMDRKTVWCEDISGERCSGYGEVNARGYNRFSYVMIGNYCFDLKSLGETWFAYLYKPSELQKVLQKHYPNLAQQGCVVLAHWNK